MLALAPGVPEARECVVFDWLGGANLSSRVNPERWAAQSELMGRMHRFASTWTPPADLDEPTFDGLIPYGEPLVLFDQDPADLFSLTRSPA